MISATSLKAVYFSVFYTAINRPLEITEVYKNKVTNYLNFHDVSLLGAVKKDFHRIVPNASRGPISSTQAMDPDLLAETRFQVKNFEKQGYSRDEIVKIFISKGWPQNQVDLLFDPLKKTP